MWRAFSRNVLGVLVLSLPYVLVGLEAARSGFLSNDHAYLVEKALLVRDRGRLEWIGFAYPPLPVVLLLLWPSPHGAIVLTSLCAGAVAWGIWRTTERLQLDAAVRISLQLAVMVAPSTAFLGTQSLSSMLGLLLLFSAWGMYVAFTRAERTDAGILAALVVALAFFANFYAPFFAASSALSTPLFTRPRSGSHLMAMLLVLVFPSLLAVASWVYLSWLFTGDGLRFLYDPNSSLMAAFRPDEAFLTADGMLREGLRRALSAPLYLGVGVLIARYRPGRLPAYGIPVLLNFGAWSLGWVVPLAFDRSLRLLFAVAGIPGRMPRRLGSVLVLLALLQVVADGPTLVTGEPGRWWRALGGGALPEDQVEQRIGRELSRLPCGSVLADDREAYRVIARAGTACPFVLPPDPIFEMAVAAPARFVSYVLVAEQPRGSGPVEWRYRTQPPQGFAPELSWLGWRLYRRLDTGGEARAESGRGRP